MRNTAKYGNILLLLEQQKMLTGETKKVYVEKKNAVEYIGIKGIITKRS